MMLLFQWVPAIILLINLSMASSACQKCSCGLSGNTDRIAGFNATLKKFPWAAMILLHGVYICAGSLINDKYVLTASHCINEDSLSLHEVYLLRSRLDSKLPITLKREISQVIGNNNNNQENAISLLKLSQPVRFNALIRPVCLPSTSRSYVGQQATVIGWAATDFLESNSPQMLEDTVPIIPIDRCQSFELMVSTSMLCAAAKGKDSCKGDSGSPLHVVRKSKFTQIGIVSFGRSCADAESTGIYTKVSSFMGWIRENTKDACTCK